MSTKKLYESDMGEILSHRQDNGADLWTTPDQRLIKGSPFSTLESVMYLLELGVEPHESIMKDTAELIWRTWRADGDVRNSALVVGRKQNVPIRSQRLLPLMHFALLQITTTSLRL